MEAWPATVPSLAQSGTMKITPHRAPLATDMEDGSQRRRRSTTKNIATVPFSILMSNSQFATFKAWERDTLVDGVLPFTASVFTDVGPADRICRFTETYSDEPTDGTHHVVAVSLDIEDF